MFIINLFPFFAKNNPVLYSWLGALSVSKLGVDNVVLVGTQLQLLPPSKQIHADWINGVVKSISDEDWARVKKIVVPDSIQSINYAQSNSGYDYFVNVTTSTIENYTSFLSGELRSLNLPIDTLGISAVNDKSFEAACNSASIKVIYTEGGAIRRSEFPFGTYFFDWKGINGAHGFDDFFREAINELSNDDYLPIEVIVNTLYKCVRLSRNDSPSYEVAVALQVEDDSNLIVYSNGFDSLKLLFKALWVYPRNLVLIREHPKSKFKIDTDEFGDVDTSARASDFILKAKRLITINSSVAFEGVLLGVETYVFGGSPFNVYLPQSIQRDLSYHVYDGCSKEQFVNIFLIAYLVPEWFWLDAEYFRWRASRPSLKDIFLKNLNSYRERGYFSSSGG